MAALLNTLLTKFTNLICSSLVCYDSYYADNVDLSASIEIVRIFVSMCSLTPEYRRIYIFSSSSVATNRLRIVGAIGKSFLFFLFHT